MAQVLTDIKYKATFVGKDGTKRTINIKDGGQYASSVILDVVDLQLNEDNTEDIFAPVRTWSGTISFFNNKGLSLSSFIPTTSTSIVVEILKGATLEFTGYLSGEALAQTYPSDGEILSVGIVSRLNVGNGLEYDDTTSSQIGSNITTIGKLMYGCLKQCGYQDNDAILVANGFSINGDVKNLFACEIDRYRFYNKINDETEEKEYEHDNCTSIIAELIRPFGFICHERANTIYLWNFNGISSYKMFLVSDLLAIEMASPMVIQQDVLSLDLYSREQKQDFYRGRKKFRVTLDYAHDDLASNLLGDLMNFANLDYANVTEERIFGGQGDQYRIKYFEPISKVNANARTYPYYFDGVNWQQENDLARWATGMRPGCTPIRYIEVRNDASADSWQPYLNERNFDEEFDYKEGLIINPTNSETQANPSLNLVEKTLIDYTSKKDYIFYGGQFDLSFSMAAYRQNEQRENNPSLRGMFFRDQTMVGDKYYRGVEQARAEGTQYGWQTTADWLRLHIYGAATEGDVQMAQYSTYGLSPTHWHGKKAIAENNGMVKSHNPIWLRGKFKWKLRIEQYSTSAFVGIILKDLKITYTNLAINERGDNGEDKNQRVYFLTSDNGFDGEEIDIHTKIGSWSDDCGLALSSIYYNQLPLETINVNSVSVAPEQALVETLKRYYDRAQEIRTLTIEDTTEVNSGELVSMDNKLWIILSTSIDYANGTRKVVLTEKID